MERYESDYSEDFEEEEVSSAAVASSKPSAAESLSLERPWRRRKARPRVQGGGRGRDEEVFATPRRQPAVGKSRSTGAGRRIARERDAEPSRRSFLPRRLEPGKAAGLSPARERQLSAINHALHGLQNKLAERERRLEEVVRENRLLARMQKKQEREWTRIQQQEDELPQILQRHEKEVKSLRQQLRKSHDQVLSDQQKIAELQERLCQASEAKQKLESVVGRKKLREREQLAVRVDQLTKDLAERERRVTELERGLEASGKTHSQELKGLRARNKALGCEAVLLRDTAEKLQSLLKEKTREMEVMNIYSQRLPRGPARPHPPSPPPVLPPAAVCHQSSQTTLSCPPFKSVSMQNRSQLKTSSSQTEVVQPIAKSDSSTQTRGEGLPLTSNTTMTDRAHERLFEVSTAHTEGKAASESVCEAEVVTQRSRQELLQKLRQLDSQKTAPASNPLAPPSVAMATINPLSPASVAMMGQAVTRNTESQNVATSPGPSKSGENSSGEQERKRLLLAKLMAIDEGSNPNHIKITPPQRQSGSQRTLGLNRGSSSSLTSWPEVVENMHHGRPAHASEEDPFGSRARLSGWRRGGGGVGRGSSGVRVREEQNVFVTEPVQRQTEKPQDEGSYKPLFGRRAAHTDSAPQHKPHPPPIEGSGASEHSSGPTPSISRGGLLPRRPKADAAIMKSNDVMLGAVIAEPDDLEELVL